ncbi:ABC transporter ATP-binding protein [Cryptosporangium phraense]|uniref:ABC transporter ATP-binding protein n=1 Tax=Cryptosporangium phraense TaxID=2593070 RepID=A0A545AV52_9ACTN|nr:ABC transporter ATP-binding protein [Cryptosporangium phraense]TQS45193.1 ABC transporter ATP-binding protein [Cryptosporangium phraense]
MTRLKAEGVALGYDGRRVVHGLDLTIPDGSFTAIVGANGSGKSTLLRGLARLLKPENGSVVLDGKAIGGYSSKEVARRLGLLPQSQTAPDAISVRDLVARGRYPHQTLLRQWSPADQTAVDAALKLTGTTELATRLFDELSGGQRQRVWLALALAQETDILLLDEPTTYLDLRHQIDVLDLCARLRTERGSTLVAVLHDLNLAARYATHLVAMKDGAIVAEGEPAEVITPTLIEDVFGLPCRVIDDPESGTPLIIPRLTVNTRKESLL